MVRLAPVGREAAMSARRLSRLGRLGAGLLMASLWAVAAGPVAAADRAEPRRAAVTEKAVSAAVYR